TKHRCRMLGICKVCCQGIFYPLLPPEVMCHATKRHRGTKTQRRPKMSRVFLCVFVSLCLGAPSRLLDSRNTPADTASPMSRAIILQHAAHAAPGRIVPIIRDFGIPTETRKLWQGDEVPTDLDEVRLLVVLGGMKFEDVTAGRFPYLATEVKTLQRMVGIDRAVLAIDFGAQLLAHAAGAKVHPNVKASPLQRAGGAHGQTAPPPAETSSPPELLPE